MGKTIFILIQCFIFFISGNANSEYLSNKGLTQFSTSENQIIGQDLMPECFPPPLSMTNWWPGDNNVTDITGSHIDGVLHDGAGYSAGMVNQAFSLDGVNDFLDFGTTAGNFGTSDFSVAFWVKFNNVIPEQVLIEKYIETYSSAVTGWGLTRLPNNTFRFYATSAFTDFYVDVTNSVWYFITITRSGSLFNIYWNGVLVASANFFAVNVNSTSTLKLGHRGNPDDTPGSVDTRGFYLNGFADELVLFSNALPASEIMSIYSAGSEGLCRPPKILNLTTFIQGYYDNTLHSMESDTISVYLRDNLTPYSIVDSSREILNSNGNGVFYFNSALAGTNYLLQIKHRNSIETWSSSAIEFVSGFSNYDFSSSPVNAYGSNETLIDISPLRYAVYNGDVNQDGAIDMTDILMIHTDAISFVSGYAVTDVNGDNITDLSDLLITYNNSSNFVERKIP